jgi:hypothetical protein
LICDLNAPKRGKVTANLLTLLLIKLPSSYFLINGGKTKLLSLFQEKIPIPAYQDGWNVSYAFMAIHKNNSVEVKMKTKHMAFLVAFNTKINVSISNLHKEISRIKLM